jgi:hypothetical protein
MELEFCWQIFETLKYQISWKRFGGSRVYICGWTHRQTDMTELIVAFRNFANAPKIARHIRFPRCISIYCLNSSEDLSAKYSTSSSLFSLLVFLKIMNGNGNVERSFAVIVQVSSITNSEETTRHDAWPVWVVRLPFLFGCNRHCSFKYIKHQSKHTSFLLNNYYFRPTCFHPLESSSGPPWSRCKII